MYERYSSVLIYSILLSFIIFCVIVYGSTWSDAKVSYWNSDTDGSFPDDWGSNNGTISGASYTASGKINGAYDFDGLNDKVTVTDNSNLQINGNMSIVLWFKSDDMSGSKIGLLAKRDAGGTNYQLDNFQSKIRFYDGTNVVYTDSTYLTDTWYHVVFTASDGVGKIYVNNTQQSTTTSGDTVSITSNDAPLYIGHEVVNSLWLDGLIDEIAIFNKSLNTTERNDIYNNGLGAPDIIVPTYSNNYTNSTIKCTDILHALKWEDGVGLDTYIFSFDNGSGTLVNDSLVDISGTTHWSNVTKGVNHTVGSTIRWQVFANDTSNNWNASDIYEYVTTSDTTSPTYSLSSTNSTLIGHDVLHSLKWEDNIGLDTYIFSFDNGTGTLSNDSLVDISGTSTWSNVIKRINHTVGTTIQWQMFANDTDNNWGGSDIYEYVTTSSLSEDNHRVLYIQMDGNASDIWNDYDGSITDATLINDKDGHINSAYGFNGSANISLSGSNDIDMGVGTISLLFYLNSSSLTTPALITKRDIANGTDWQFDIVNNKLRIYNGTNIDYADSNITTDEWHRYSIVFHDNDTISFWLDGESDGETELYINHTDAVIRLGHEVVNDFYLNGSIDDVCIHNRTLIYSEIYTVYSSGCSAIGGVSESIVPTYSNNYTNSTLKGTDILHALKWEDNYNLDTYIFSFDNGTGTLSNDSLVDISGTTHWSNVTKGVNHTVGSTIRWQVFANDTSNNWNASDIYEYVTTSPPVGFISITYPPTNRLYQRNASDIGAIDIYGKYTGIVYAIESRFDGGTWKNISLNPSNNEFFGQLNVSIGQGDLDIRVCGESNITTIENISVGDLYLIAGQSNAVGGGINNQIINDSNIYTPMMYSISDTWTVLKDPVGGWLGSVWVPLANTIIKETSIPIAFIPTAVSASVISEWNKGDPNYNNMISQTHEATNNTDLIKALLWYQGEGDASVNSGVQGEYTPYYTQLGQFSTDVMNDINAERVLVGQIGETGESWSIDRSGADNIRKAQQDLWDNYDNISYGCITYDINLTVDRLHFKTDIELGNFSNRWWAGLDYHIYSNTDGRAAKVLNISRSESNKIVIAMNKSIKPSNVTGNLKGFKIYNGTDDLTDSDITNASVVNGSYIELTLSSTIGTGAKLNYSSYNDANDVIIPIGTTSHETPIRPIYDESIQIQSVDSCSPPAINTNHIFDLVDNCTIDDDWDIGTGNITFINTGTITFNATIIANSIGNLPAHQRGYIGSEARVREGGG